MPKNEVVDVLWTGGWDSTFRVLTLLSRGSDVRPHYLGDTERHSEPEERSAIDAISAGVMGRGWRGRLHPLVVVSKPSLDADAEVEARLLDLKERATLGKQYAALARYAAQHLNGRPLDLSVHLDDKAEVFVRPHVVEAPDGDGYVLGPTDDDAVRLFAPFRFPLLDFTKKQMADVAEAKGFADLMGLTWFCHNPVRRRGRPAQACGVCGPCRFSYEEGMGHRIGLAGHVRRVTDRPLRPVREALGDLRFRLGVGAKLRALAGRTSPGARTDRADDEHGRPRRDRTGPPLHPRTTASVPTADISKGPLQHS